MVRTASRRIPHSQRYALRRAAADDVLNIDRGGGNFHDFIAAVDDFAFARNKSVVALDEKNLFGFSGPARKAEKFQGNWRRWRRRLYLIYAVGLLLVWRDRADHRRDLHVLGLRYKNVSSRGCVLSGLGGGD